MLLREKTSAWAPIIVSLKALLLLTLFWSVAPEWVPIVISRFYFLLFQHKYLVLAVYCVVFVLSVLAICVTPFLKSWQTRVPLLIVFVVSFAFDQFIVDITGVHLDTAMMRTIWVENFRGLS